MRRPPDPLAVRLYRRALVLVPRCFRRRHGAAMVAMLAEEWRERRGPGRAVLLARALLDLGRTALLERIRPVGDRVGEGPAPPHGTSGRRPGRGTPGGPPRRAAGVSLLDVKLGFRMLVRHPGLTLVGGLAMAFAICVGAGVFELLTRVAYPTLPLPEGDRIVGLQHRSVADGGRTPTSLDDFVRWRDTGIGSIEGLAAHRLLERNLITDRGAGRPVRVSEISASGFRVAGVAPLMGRTLVEADERPGAPAVVVVDEHIWRTRLGGSADAVGRAVQLGRTEATVVGVMPDGFGFPLWHEAWVPLRPDAARDEPGPSPSVRIFGRLAPGVDLDEARAEVATLAARMAADSPTTHANLRARVVPYTNLYIDLSDLGSVLLVTGNVFLVALLILVCGNVALLMFARAASRHEEIVVRSALGASRARIVGQLFVEALVLGALAGAVGLAAAGRSLAWGMDMVREDFLNGNEYPFWITPGVSADTVVYAAALSVLAAVVAGVVPGLLVTGRGLASRLRGQGSGTAGARMGGIWTAVIVAQVALTVVFPATGFLVARTAGEVRSLDPGFPVGEYATARLGMDQAVPAPGEAPVLNVVAARASLRELERRLEADPRVVGVTFADHLPRMDHPWSRIEVDGGGVPPEEPGRGHGARSASVAPDYFDVLGAEVLAGRGLRSADLEVEAPVVVVNRSFVERVLGGRSPLGRRVRYVDPDDRPRAAPPDPTDGERSAPDPTDRQGAAPAAPIDPDPGDPADPVAPVAPNERRWYEIVGVVPDLGMGPAGSQAGLYHPTAPEHARPLQIAVHARGEPAAVAPRLRAVAAAVDPGLRIYDPRPLAEADFGGTVQLLRFWFRMIVGVGVIATLLALSGIYAVMSFTVSRRTREIGVRVALGARPWRVVLDVFRRPAAQVGSGLLAGVVLTLLVAVGIWGPGAVSPRGGAWLAAFALLMAAVCALASFAPVRRALRLEPTEALTADE